MGEHGTPADPNALSSPHRAGSFSPILACVLAAALFGASTPASRPLVESMGPFLLSGVLYLGAALAVAPWALRDVRTARSANLANGLRLGGAVLFGGIVGPVLLLSGLVLAPAGSVALWLNLESVATALLAWLFFREHVGVRTIVAIALIVVGSVMLSPSTPQGGLAVALVAGACLAWGLDNNLTALIDQFSPAQTTFAKGLVAGTFNCLIGVHLLGGTTSLPMLAAALCIGGLSYGASLLLYVAGAQHLGATRSQLIFSTAPAWGLAIAWVVLGEPILPVQLGAAGLMAAAIVLWHREQHSHAHVHEPMRHNHRHRHDDGHHDHDHAEPFSGTWHAHEHDHARVEHEHRHHPDLHHRHAH